MRQLQARVCVVQQLQPMDVNSKTRTETEVSYKETLLREYLVARIHRRQRKRHCLGVDGAAKEPDSDFGQSAEVDVLASA